VALRQVTHSREVIKMLNLREDRRFDHPDKAAKHDDVPVMNRDQFL
jgi:hypothetical protein